MEGLTDALARMGQIENRLKAVEQADKSASVAGQSQGEVDRALGAYQAQLLVRLKEIRNAMEASGGDIVAITAERDSAVQENARLRKDVEQLNYRIRHLIKELTAEEAKNQDQKL